MHGIEFVFPNDLQGPAWTVMIVLYPYITGLVAGAFVVAALHEVFNKHAFGPIARFALVGSFCFCAFATMPLLLHLHQPQRALNIMFTPNFTSAMSGFGFIYSFYLLLLTVEILLVFRSDIVRLANEEQGPVERLLYRVLALGVVRETPASQALDKKVIHWLSIIGIPAACVLHGYVGFIFGGIKANPWWSSPIMPVIFLCSAIVSGVAMLALLYVVVSKLRGVAPDDLCLRELLRLLWLMLALATALELLELMNKAYEQGEEWHMMSRLISEHLATSFTIVQLGLGSLVPLVVLPYAFSPKRSAGARRGLAAILGLLVLVQVLAMRWNVVVGGQLMSKSFRGFNAPHLEIGGREGLIAAIVVFTMPFVLMAVASKLLPVWKAPASDGQHG